MSDRLSQVSGHLSNTHGRGLLAGEVAIITGELRVFNVIAHLYPNDRLVFRVYPHSDPYHLPGAGQVQLDPLTPTNYPSHTNPILPARPNTGYRPQRSAPLCKRRRKGRR